MSIFKTERQLQSKERKSFHDQFKVTTVKSITLDELKEKQKRCLDINVNPKFKPMVDFVKNSAPNRSVVVPLPDKVSPGITTLHSKTKTTRRKTTNYFGCLFYTEIYKSEPIVKDCKMCGIPSDNCFCNDNKLIDICEMCGIPSNECFCNNDEFVDGFDCVRCSYCKSEITIDPFDEKLPVYDYGTACEKCVEEKQEADYLDALEYEKEFRDDEAEFRFMEDLRQQVDTYDDYDESLYCNTCKVYGECFCDDMYADDDSDELRSEVSEPTDLGTCEYCYCFGECHCDLEAKKVREQELEDSYDQYWLDDGLDKISDVEDELEKQLREEAYNQAMDSLLEDGCPLCGRRRNGCTCSGSDSSSYDYDSDSDSESLYCNTCKVYACKVYGECFCDNSDVLCEMCFKDNLLAFTSPNDPIITYYRHAHLCRACLIKRKTLLEDVITASYIPSNVNSSFPKGGLVYKELMLKYCK